MKKVKIIEIAKNLLTGTNCENCINYHKNQLAHRINPPIVYRVDGISYNIEECPGCLEFHCKRFLTFTLKSTPTGRSVQIDIN